MALSVGLAEGLLALIVPFVVWKLLLRVGTSETRLPYPPGPPGLPLLGNVSSLDGPSHMAYHEMCKSCDSDVIRLHAFGANIIILDSFQAAVDLLDKRSSIYSDRPTSSMTMWNELVGLGWSFAFQAYSQEWRDGRKVIHREFSADAFRKHRPVLERETHKLLRRFLRTPENFMTHIQKLTGGEIMSVVYDIEVLEDEDPYIATALKISNAASTILRHGTYLVDFIPILKHVPEWAPGADFKRKALVWRKSVLDMLNKPYDLLLARKNSHQEIQDCVAKSLLDEVVAPAPDPAYMERIVKGAMASMYLGGSDTTLSIFWSFILAMVLHPQAQRRAQEEIDRVCAGRLPEFGDMGTIPYVDALVRESLRWNPVVLINLAHRCTEDNEYRGWLIPGGSVVLSNLWAMLHDEEAYPDPFEFKPERFLKLSGTDYVLDLTVRDPAQITYGFGRRICPGRFMAYESLWLTIASILAVFDLKPCTNADGHPVPPFAEYDYAFTCHPKPFECSIKPRSARHEALIVETGL